MSDDTEYLHNKGQEDAKNGEYDSPGSCWLPDCYSPAEKEAYDQGWRNTTDQ